MEEKKNSTLKLFRNRYFCITLILLFFLTLLPNLAYSNFFAFRKRYRNFRQLKNKIQLKSCNLDFEVAYFIKDLTFPRLVLKKNETKYFPAASVIKIPLLAAAFYAIKEEKIAFDTPIVIRKRDITSGSGILKHEQLPIKLSFLELLELMIAHSDNTATNKVIEILGFDYINLVFKKMGLKDTFLRRKMMDFSKRDDGIENYTTAKDIAILLEKIYYNRFIDKKFSQLALQFLLKQKIKDRIPKYLPESTKVAHKTGLERKVVHDVGIIYAPNGNYIFCVLTKGVKKYSQGKEFIAKLSKLTYDHYR